MLRTHDMHGYQIAEAVEASFGGDGHIKKATLYDTLRKLAEEGLLDGREEREGKRPPRVVYTITDAGEAEFTRLLKKDVVQPESWHALDAVGLMFLAVLPSAEATQLLLERRDAAMAVAEAHEEAEPHPGVMAGLIMDRVTRHARVEIEWLDDAIATLEDAETGAVDE
jgi:PadR family transcriptional regulator AphA